MVVPLGGCGCVCCSLPWAGCFPNVDVQTFVYSESTTAGLSISAMLNKYSDFQTFALNGVTVTKELIRSTLWNNNRILNGPGPCVWQSPILACGVVIVLFVGSDDPGVFPVGRPRMFLGAISADASLGPFPNIVTAEMNPPCTDTTGGLYGSAGLLTCGTDVYGFPTPCPGFDPTTANGSVNGGPYNGAFWGGLLSGSDCLPFGNDDDDWGSIRVTPA